ncbi:hypothetical protein SISNIDRAFT_259742 [Sistotremastrum niveocremeum HHB9708]|uniref:Uncharacterized protein n=1 Tax=Sistotremastrum niveocremeum HHB9708 TaxID=1314777 RepID=A0A164P956_9AGAM|nr:hypothetical protein SISNIDRAFT_259742 [Sistotremastrum niveocremeum HHB9708]
MIHTPTTKQRPHHQPSNDHNQNRRQPRKYSTRARKRITIHQIKKETEKRSATERSFTRPNPKSTYILPITSYPSTILSFLLSYFLTKLD